MMSMLAFISAMPDDDYYRFRCRAALRCYARYIVVFHYAAAPFFHTMMLMPDAPEAAPR